MIEVCEVVHHTNSLSCACSLCKTYFWKQIENGEELKKLIENASSKLYKCNECMKPLSDEESLKTHIRKYHWSYKCSLCDAKFMRKDVYDRHCKRSHHGDISTDCEEMKSNAGSTLISQIIEGTDDSIKKYKCNFCTKIFNDVKSANMHAGTQHGTVKVYTCEICGKKCNKSSNLLAHMVVHDHRRPWKCSICKKAFTQLSVLNSHKKAVHSMIKPYKCEFCQQAFAGSGGLTIHRRIHTGEKPYECGTCGKRFRRNTDLLKHERRHSGVKQHQCDFCDKRFYSTNGKTIHERTHTGDQPYKCKVCNKAFSQQNSVGRHMVTHTQEKRHKCDICGMSFTQGCSVARHKKVAHCKNKS